MQKAIIIGATSGIGRALALVLSRNGYAVGITGRREELLIELRNQLPGPSAFRRMDVTQPEEALQALEELIAELGGMDLLVISSGVGIPNPDLDWRKEQATIDVNVSGFVLLATTGYRYFSQQDSGHLVGISSIAGVRGSRFNPAYGASKAFEMNYLEGLRARAYHEKRHIAVTDIRPGFIATPMTAANEMMFWVAPVEKAAEQIYRAIVRKRRVAYVTRRWAFIAWLLRRLPEWVVEKF
ncbi:MAG: SDR family NAD(P)-dependent oxidoreductase [Armatimonadota bacterium]